MSDRTRLTGNVARILNDRELVINIGSLNGVAAGVRFAVLAKESLEIRDPQSGEVLGVMDREKIRVQAIDVQDRYTVCATYETRVVRSGSTIGALYDALSPAPRIVVKTLKAADYPEPLSEDESYVKIGDRVVELHVDPVQVEASRTHR